MPHLSRWTSIPIHRIHLRITPSCEVSTATLFSFCTVATRISANSKLNHLNPTYFWLGLIRCSNRCLLPCVTSAGRNSELDVVPVGRTRAGLRPARAWDYVSDRYLAACQTMASRACCIRVPETVAFRHCVRPNAPGRSVLFVFFLRCPYGTLKNIPKKAWMMNMHRNPFLAWPPSPSMLSSVILN